jgi:hypothetical protein
MTWCGTRSFGFGGEMSTWRKLIEFSKTNVERGALLRFPAGDSFEEHAVMMVCEAPGDSERTGLMTISGYKPGTNCYVVFPGDAETNPLPTKWLVNNWSHWVWPLGDVTQVQIREPLRADEL